MLIRNDGAILSVESFSVFSEDHTDGESTFSERPRTFGGLARFESSWANINDMTMQAVRNAADILSETYENYALKYAPAKEDSKDKDEGGWFD
jgi:hypothetical protein